MLRSNKVAIIGGAGFIGSKLSSCFNRSKIVFDIFDVDTSSEIKKILKINVEDPASLKVLSGYDSLINLAAVHEDDVKPITRYDDVNVKGAENICNAARIYNINKIIFISSVAIYGFAKANTDEKGEPNFFNDYGRTKYLAEQVYLKWQAQDKDNRTLIIIRPTVVFGEGNRGNIYKLFNQIASRRFVMLGNGKNIKSIAYVDNLAAFMEYSMSFRPGLHVYNYIDKPDIDMNTLVSKTRKLLFKKNNVGFRIPAFLGISLGYCADFLSKITGKSLPISSVRIKKFMTTTQFSSAVSNTDFIPPVNLETALERTISYEFLEEN